MTHYIGAWARRLMLGAAAGAVMLLALPDAAHAETATQESAQHARSAGKKVSKKKTATKSKASGKDKAASKKKKSVDDPAKVEQDAAEGKAGKKDKTPALSKGVEGDGDFKDESAKPDATPAPKDKKAHARHGKTAKASHDSKDKEKAKKPEASGKKKKHASVTQ